MFKPGALVLIATVALLGVSLLGPGSVRAQEQDPQMKNIIEQNLAQQVISLESPLQELVPEGTRDSVVTTEITLQPYSPDEGKLRDMFLEGGEIETKSIDSGPYGTGTEYSDANGHTLSIYEHGFVYFVSRDQIEPVGEREIVKRGPNGAPAYKLNEQGQPIVNYKFGKKEAAEAARNYLEENFRSPSSSGDVNTSVRVNLKNNSERVAIVDFVREFLGVPLLDEKIRVVLDGNKEVITLSYFFSDKVTPGKQLEDVMAPELVLQFARRKAMEAYQGQPPLFTLFGMKLGYVTRGSFSNAKPAWLLDLRYNQPKTVTNEPNRQLQKFGMKRTVQGVAQMRRVLGISAYREQLVEL